MRIDDGFEMYERRRLKLQELVNEHGSQKSLADKVGIADSVISRMLYPAGKKNKRNIGEKSARIIEDALSLPRNWMDGISEEKLVSPDQIDYVGKLKLGAVQVVGEAALGVDGMIQMEEHQAGWLQIYSADPNAYGLRVRGDSMHPRIQSGEFVVIEPGTRIQSGDEVFVRTSDGHNMIKIVTKMRDGSFQFSSVNHDHRPITLQANEIEKMEYVSAIIKATRFVATADVSDI